MGRASPPGADLYWAVELCLLLLSFVRKKGSGGKFGVCLNIYMQNYNWRVMYLKGPSQKTGGFL